MTTSGMVNRITNMYTSYAISKPCDRNCFTHQWAVLCGLPTSFNFYNGDQTYQFIYYYILFPKLSFFVAYKSFRIDIVYRIILFLMVITPRLWYLTVGYWPERTLLVRRWWTRRSRSESLQVSHVSWYRLIVLLKDTEWQQICWWKSSQSAQ